MTVRHALRVVAGVGAVAVLSGHVGSPDVWYVGDAGPYAVRVIVQPPGVVPGLADIIVRVSGGGVERVFVMAAHWDAAEDESPPPDLASPVAGDPEAHTARLWLMERGEYRIMVTVEGARGRGTIFVPVTAQSTERLALKAGTAAALAGAGVVLFVGLLTLIGAAVREGVVPPGEEPDSDRRGAARRAIAGGAVVAALVLFGGWTWWDRVDEAHRARLDRPWTADAEVLSTGDGDRVLRLSITDPWWVARDRFRENPSRRALRYAQVPLIADHGKLMHMFLVREPGMDAFAHLHPSSQDSTEFLVALPPLPKGRYSVYADLVQASGATRTIVTDVDLSEALDPWIPDGPAPPAPDPDDGWWSGPPHPEPQPGRDAPTPNGHVIRWIQPTRLFAGREVDLEFRLLNGQGGSAVLEPYMGMRGHAMIRRDDGSVFVHLHPSGSVSAAAVRAVEARGSDAVRAARHDVHDAVAASDVSFPYAFPRAGSYRLWVQVRSGGEVLSGGWDVRVEPDAG